MRFYSERWTKVFSTSVPNNLLPYYKDVVSYMQDRVRRKSWSSLTWESKFVGIIPDDTKAKIKAARADFADKTIYLLAEADWSEKYIEAPKVDPLVVGIKDGRMYLIDHFDLTTLEKYVMMEMP